MKFRLLNEKKKKEVLKGDEDCNKMKEISFHLGCGVLKRQIGPFFPPGEIKKKRSEKNNWFPFILPPTNRQVNNISSLNDFAARL